MTTAPGFEPPVLSLLVNLQTASVPGFAPVGADAEHFSRHRWGTGQMPEVVAHASSTWASIRQPSDFFPHLTLELFDATRIADLAASLGAGQLVAVARDTDGLAWWPSNAGPSVGRDVVGELADAATEADLAFGIALRSGPNTADDIVELEARYAPSSFRELWGAPVADGSWTSPPPWATTAPVARRLPAAAPTVPWELRRGFGPSLGYNRVERDADFVSTAALCALVARTRACGGSVLLDLPLNAQGSVPPAMVDVVEAPARWLSSHIPDLEGCASFDVAGDDTVSYLSRPGPAPGTRDVVVVDLDATGHRSIAHFSPHRYPVIEVRGASRWSQDTAGIHLTAPDEAVQSAQGRRLPIVTTLTVTDRRTVTLAVQGRRTPGTVHIGDSSFPTIGAALRMAQCGDVVAVSAGRYGPESETFPLFVPAGVTLSGPPPLRRPTALGVDRAGELTAQVVGGGTLFVLDGDGATLRHVAVHDETNPLARQTPVVRGEGRRNVVIDSCEFTGTVELVDTVDASMTWNRFDVGGIVTRHGSGASLVGNRFVKAVGEAPAILIQATGEVRVEATSCLDTAVGIALLDVTGAHLSANSTSGRRHGIELRRTSQALLSGNRVAAMRGFLIDHSSDIEIAASSVERVDTAVLMLASTGVSITGTHLSAARVGVMFCESPDDREAWDIDRFASATEAALVEVPRQ